MKLLSAYLSGCTERIARDIWGGGGGAGDGGSPEPPWLQGEGGDRLVTARAISGAERSEALLVGCEGNLLGGGRGEGGSSL